MQSYSEKLESTLLEQAQKDNIERMAVGGIILDETKTKLLLLKRHPSDFLPNLEELPSGKVEHDESLNEAVIREVKEETDLDVIEVTNYLNSFDYFSKSGKKTRQFNFILTTKSTTTISLLPDEHSSFTWHSLQKPTTALTPIMQEIIEMLKTSCGKQST